MWYREAYKIGSVCEGTIKCTYANIYDENGKVLFSMQHRDVGRLISEELFTQQFGMWNVDSPSGYNPDQMVSPNAGTQEPEGFMPSSWRDGNWLSPNAPVVDLIGRHIPLVYIDEISDKRLVPAYIGEKALYLIKDTIYGGAGGTQYDMLTRDIHNKKWLQGILKLQPNQRVWIKPAAFNWFPCNIKNATVDGVNLCAEIERLENEVKNLKNLRLLAVGGTVVL